MIGVLGATGRVGSLVVRGLADEGVDACAIVRSTGNPGPLRTRRGDLTNLPSMRRALRGVTRLFLLTPNSAEQLQLEATALQAARDTGVEHIVKISGGASTLGPNGTTATSVAHWRSEQAIEQSGIGFTFLRPSFYAQNLLETVAPRAAQLGVLPAPFGRAAIAMLDVRDLAACAVAALIEPTPADRAWTVTGPRSVTFEAIGEQLGLRVVRTAPQLNTRALRRSGASAKDLDHALRMSAYLAAGSDAVVTDHVPRLIGRPARPIEAFLDEHADAFAPATTLARTLTRLTTKELR